MKADYDEIRTYRQKQAFNRYEREDSMDYFDLIDSAGLPPSLQPTLADVLPINRDQLPSAEAPQFEGDSE